LRKRPDPIPPAKPLYDASIAASACCACCRGVSAPIGACAAINAGGTVWVATSGCTGATNTGGGGGGGGAAAGATAIGAGTGVGAAAVSGAGAGRGALLRVATAGGVFGCGYCCAPVSGILLVSLGFTAGCVTSGAPVFACSACGRLCARRAASCALRTRSASAAAALGSDARDAGLLVFGTYRAVGRTSVISVGCCTGGAALLPSCTGTSARPFADVRFGAGIGREGAMYGVNGAYPAA